MTKIYIFLISSLYSLSIFSLNPCPDNPEDKWHNCFGSYQYPSGETYSGEWKNNLFDGDGVFLYQNGDRYVGQFKKALPEGNGPYQFKTGDLMNLFNVFNSGSYPRVKFKVRVFFKTIYITFTT